MNDTLEAQIARPKLIRKLYNELGDVEGYRRATGYTTHIDTVTASQMRQRPVNYRIKRPSETKERIIKRYYDDGWNIRVYAYNVVCDKYVPTSDPRVFAHLYETRDTNTYEYVLLKEDDE